MSIEQQYTRAQWEAQGGWVGVERYVDNVTLLFHTDRYEEAWESDAEYDGPVPFEYYRRDERGAWELEEHGSDEPRVREARAYEQQRALAALHLQAELRAAGVPRRITVEVVSGFANVLLHGWRDENDPALARVRAALSLASTATYDQMCHALRDRLDDLLCRPPVQPQPNVTNETLSYSLPAMPSLDSFERILAGIFLIRKYEPDACFAADYEVVYFGAYESRDAMNPDEQALMKAWGWHEAFDSWAHGV